MGIVLATITAIFWVWAALSGAYQLRTLPDLSRMPADSPSSRLPVPPPSVRLVAAARNESEDIEEAVGSMLALDYPNLEIVIINDRSTDETGAILERIAQENRGNELGTRLTIKTVETLPDGWLGKNHALHLGAEGATTQWLLFTDGDIRFQPKTLRQAIAFAEHKGLDHLALGPAMLGDHGFLKAFVSFFTVLFTIYVRPDKALDPKSSAHVGIGAFNLVRTQAYRAIGGHERIAMRPDDDLKLGKLLKQGGFRQMAVPGRGLIEVYWYRTMGETIVGLEKNVFAALEYSLLRALALGPPYFLFNFGPFLGPLLTTGSERWLYSVALGALILAAASAGRFATGSPLASAVGYPFAAAFFLYVFSRAVYLTYRRGGIVWRDSFYSLRDLRRNRI